MSRTANFSNALLNLAFKNHSSDIHFVPEHKRTKIYFRINGERAYYKSIPASKYRSLLAHFKFLSGMDIGENRRPQSAAIYHFNELYDLRLSTLPIAQTESLAIRILPHNVAYTLEESFLFPYQLKQVLTYLKQKSGLFLISGPTGSGKSVTMYNLLRFLVDTYGYQTITIEDPIEQSVNGIIQMQLNQATNLSYANGLKAALRHDPDVIMIGEIRDAETAFSAFEAALTGHLVFSTIHAKNAVGTVQRLLEMGLSQTDLRQSLLGIISTKLITIDMEHMNRRAALLEILAEEHLEIAIKHNGLNIPKFQTFLDLKKKAHAYGYISNLYV